MNTTRHGIEIGITRIDSHIFLSLKAQGKLSHEDYQLITPMIDSALADIKKPDVDVYLDGTELEGWEARAAWDDLKLGLKHGNKFRRIAIHGNRGWQEKAARIAGWFTSGESRFFDSEQEALEWLKS